MRTKGNGGWEPPLTKDPSEPIVIPGMAHFAKTGPVGATCASCRHLSVRKGIPEGKPNTYCSKWVELMKQPIKKAPLIGAWMWACKYFEGKGDGPAAGGGSQGSAA